MCLKPSFKPPIQIIFMISFYVGANWILAEKIESCKAVCEKSKSICNSLEQSKITTEELLKDAMAKAGHQNCTKFNHRAYSGTPLLSSDGILSVCVYLTEGSQSGCGQPLNSNQRPLCYCGIALLFIHVFKRFQLFNRFAMF